MLNKVSLIGPQTGQWAEQMLQQRGIEGVRVLHGPAEPDRTAIRPTPSSGPARSPCSHGAYRLRTVRELIKRQGDRAGAVRVHRGTPDHPVSLSDYGDQLVHFGISIEGDMVMNEIVAERRCRKLRLSGLAQSLDVRLQEAAGHGLNHASSWN